MIEEINKVIDYIDNSVLKKELDNIREEIRSDSNCTTLIKKFNEAKEVFEKYNNKEEFVIAKENLLKNKSISKYIKLQNEVNILTLHINNRLKKITDQRI